jgi:hypothetical protein
LPFTTAAHGARDRRRDEQAIEHRGKVGQRADPATVLRVSDVVDRSEAAWSAPSRPAPAVEAGA